MLRTRLELRGDFEVLAAEDSETGGCDRAPLGVAAGACGQHVAGNLDNRHVEILCAASAHVNVSVFYQPLTLPTGLGLLGVAPPRGFSRSGSARLGRPQFKRVGPQRFALFPRQKAPCDRRRRYRQVCADDADVLAGRKVPVNHQRYLEAASGAKTTQHLNRRPLLADIVAKVFFALVIKNSPGRRRDFRVKM
jgi:hypothetical protein